MHNDVVIKSRQARKEYEEHFGPLTSFRSTDVNGWRWNDKPWPWEREFNFKW